MTRFINNPMEAGESNPLRFEDILKTSQYIRNGIDDALKLLQVQPGC